MRDGFTYTGAHTAQISFPLGGIGTGSVGLGGGGQLVDWEIFNHPAKLTTNGCSAFAVKACGDDGALADYRILNGDLQPPYTGAVNRDPNRTGGYGFGPSESTCAGLPHFRASAFTGTFPLAKLVFSDPGFPGRASLEAFNPLIPTNDRDSSLPAAFFEVRLLNTAPKPLNYSVCLSVTSPFDYARADNRRLAQAAGGALKLGCRGMDPGDPGYGDLTIATDAAEVSWQEYWYRGSWQDHIEMFINDFTGAPRLANRHYDGPPDYDNRARKLPNDTASLCAHFRLLPGEEQAVRFVLAWNFPNVRNTWKRDADQTPWKNHYATLFGDSAATAQYALENWARLYGDTAAFRDALFASSLEPAVIDAVASNLAVLKSAACLRLTDGTFYAFEGCGEDEGSCEGSCTHVWNYAYALPHLFPALERGMRAADYRYNQREDGFMTFRLNLPLGDEQGIFNPHACVDGQMGGVVKTYRDWKISGDGAWLRAQWPFVKKALEYAWAPTNADRWDPDQTGVISGRQHHTLDMELFGPNAWLNGFYLAALKAAAEMAAFVGDDAAAEAYRRLFEKGKAFTDANLFNGEYYGQRVDLKDRHLLDPYEKDENLPLYWNDEKQELNYQIGEGCGIDQVVAGWHANLCGLGEVFDGQQLKSALAAIYRHNFKSMRDVTNVWRLFCLNDEKGVLMCTWPEGRRRPAIPLTYSTETMTGFEYQFACHLMQEGFVAEGLEVVRAVRGRYDGEKRNPWSEIECGSNYARSMAAYSLLLAASGVDIDARRGHLRFYPLALRYPDRQPAPCALRFFFSCAGGWGTMALEGDVVMIDILYGELPLASLRLLNGARPGRVCAAGRDIPFAMMDGDVVLDEPLRLAKGNGMRLFMGG